MSSVDRRWNRGLLILVAASQAGARRRVPARRVARPGERQLLAAVVGFVALVAGCAEEQTHTPGVPPAVTTEQPDPVAPEPDPERGSEGVDPPWFRPVGNAVLSFGDDAPDSWTAFALRALPGAEGQVAIRVVQRVNATDEQATNQGGIGLLALSNGTVHAAVFVPSLGRTFLAFDAGRGSATVRRELDGAGPHGTNRVEFTYEFPLLGDRTGNRPSDPVVLAFSVVGYGSVRHELDASRATSVLAAVLRGTGAAALGVNDFGRADGSIARALGPVTK